MNDFPSGHIQKLIGYNFKNERLLQQAFVRSSYAKENSGFLDNEKLEFYGDAALDYYITRAMYNQFSEITEDCQLYSEKTEHDLTEIRAYNVDTESLAHCIEITGLQNYLLMNKSDIKNKVQNSPGVMADLFEAILGAVAIDSDWNQDELQNVVEFMLQIDDFLADVDTEEERPEKFKEENAINTLKELAEHGKCSIPEYDQPDEQVEMNDGRMMWECTCYVRSWSMRHTAYATSKKKAKRYAAYLMLCDFYGLHDEFSPEDEDEDHGE